ncbi:MULTISPECIES: LytR/AlgR family response regulator transcription factor [Chryseobacterium]|jgi:DNA-binding LytR/AlgR family response regulator|uniref:DNA-binding LytR/AlgR family response regulator n=1 Tax=Chryseobacterium rhizosphaerae TaxID=395937 RepID=A0AAE3Y9Y3_9FLAO|nr:MULTISPECIES: LytTR family DNA-binding domain-containing protein [Chryseobacterium]MDC8102335.1 LytTR family DNA-binding domain-containing protein [Chryseobacterium rhizosphaerae]MDR6526737.1 DNA-binding LytR/AlgR family response regulator [Chryseobacterium rhizosphaerae]MDR6544677.1 DNA-binding LytR/AlgR family response regulator [Chryseobacterium rhizosphaerae]REC78405.1 DNA-binding response regulator [Chryseobacterium rhizosphaerae]SMC73967.1 two component transcriptional regulator, LytT
MKLNKILIIEDEKPNADRLKRLLLKLRPHAEIVSVEDSIISAVNWLENNAAPDMIMMDVRLADGLSFEIFNKFDIRSPVIFTTAYDEYAVQAFKYNSIDYLLKPIEEEELELALRRYETFIETVPFVGTAIEGLLNYIQPKDYRKRFLIPHRDGYKTVLSEDVLYFYTELGISKAMLNTGSVENVPQTLEELEKQLDPKFFFRANRQFIIHIDSVKQIFNHFNGKLKLELRKQPEIEVVVSREKASAFKSWLDY